MNKRIILFSIGSVQNFIVNSRKTIDLYNSSKILSQIISKGIDFFKKYNSELLLPKLGAQNIPNYFLLIYENNESVGNKLEECIRNHWLEMFLFYVKKVFSKDDLENYREQFLNQLNSVLDIYWVDYRLRDEFKIENSNEYKETYNKLYEYLDGIKNIKKFNSINEEGRKCSICGERNAIFVNHQIDSRYKPQFKYSYKEYEEDGLFNLLEKLKTNNIKITYNKIKKVEQNKKDNFLSGNGIKCDLKENEILCSSCYLKRLYKYKENLHVSSTAKIAIFHWLENIKEDENYKEYEQSFQEVFKKTQGLDEYESRYPELWESKSFVNVDKLIINKLKNSFNNLKNKNITKYYCIYRMDIDDLGKWMSGKYKSDSKISFYEYQFELSRRINNFFDYVRNETDKIEEGLLVYAGGDDLMALIPVYKIYDFIKMVAEGFCKMIKEDDYKNITYSQGTFITHYRSPLGEVVRISKMELENAKERYKKKVSYFDIPKNASVISIINEGYDERSVYYKNDIDYNEFLFHNLAKYFLHKVSYYHNELESEFIELGKNIRYKYECSELISMISIEQERLIKRSILENNIVSVNITETDIDILNRKLIDFISINCIRENNIDLQNYFNLFHIMRKFNSIMKEGLKYENNEIKA